MALAEEAERLQEQVEALVGRTVKAEKVALAAEAERDAAVQRTEVPIFREQDDYLKLEAERDLAEAEVVRLRTALAVANQVIDRLITEAVDHWHTVTNDEPALHAWLGLTWEEYGTWVEGNAAGLVARAALAGGDSEGPCPHARPSWRMCPHCLGINSK